ncbi:MAG: DUF134 domain-containing protein [Bacteroidetes bacterium]|nr:DUF134 domain-containing protein [Bacteroidota bacterium]
MKKCRGRPHICRVVDFDPEVLHFKPAGVPSPTLEQITLNLDELEALRLADVEGMYHTLAAEHMHISRQTFGRIITSARRKVATALLEGKELIITGGMIMQRQHTMGRGGNCICPKCGKSVPHPQGVPCREMRCPDCGKVLLREGSDHHQQLEEKRKGKQS